MTTDGFDTQRKVEDRPEQDSKDFYDIVFAPSDSSVVYAIAVGYDFYKSTDSGESFEKLTNFREDVLNKIH